MIGLGSRFLYRLQAFYREILGLPGRWPAWRTGKSVLPHAGAPPCAAFRSLPRLRNPSLAHLAHASTEYTRLCTHTHRTRGKRAEKPERAYKTYVYYVEIVRQVRQKETLQPPAAVCGGALGLPGCASGAPGTQACAPRRLMEPRGSTRPVPRPASLPGEPWFPLGRRSRGHQRCPEPAPWGLENGYRETPQEIVKSLKSLWLGL